MAVFYCLFAVIVILMNYASLSAVIGNISTGVFAGGLFMSSGELGRRCHSGLHINPSGEILNRNLLDHPHPGLTVIQAGNVAEFLAAMLDEFLMQFDIQLIKRFQTIGNKPGGHHHHMFDAFFGQPDNALIRIGLQPWLGPEPRLERCMKTGLIPAKLLA